MTVSELAKAVKLQVISMPSPDTVIECGYAGDLLSWVMGNAQQGCAWMTITTNRNIIAVAELIDMACVIVTEGSDIPDDVAALAKEKEINLLATELPTYEMCVQVSRLI